MDEPTFRKAAMRLEVLPPIPIGTYPRFRPQPDNEVFRNKRIAKKDQRKKNLPIRWRKPEPQALSVQATDEAYSVWPS